VTDERFPVERGTRGYRVRDRRTGAIATGSVAHPERRPGRSRPSRNRHDVERQELRELRRRAVERQACATCGELSRVDRRRPGRRSVRRDWLNGCG
jgi:hypothetical protein